METESRESGENREQSKQRRAKSRRARERERTPHESQKYKHKRQMQKKTGGCRCIDKSAPTNHKPQRREGIYMCVCVCSSFIIKIFFLSLLVPCDFSFPRRRRRSSLLAHVLALPRTPPPPPTSNCAGYPAPICHLPEPTRIYPCIYLTHTPSIAGRRPISSASNILKSRW
jgi:hypothetical protein